MAAENWACDPEVVEFLITKYSSDVNKQDKVCDSEKYFVFSVQAVMFWINQHVIMFV